MLTRTRVIALASIWWLAAPFATAIFYDEQLSRGALPPQADSILIGISTYAMAWLLVTPLFIALMWWAGRGAPSRFGWTAWDPKNLVRTVIGASLALLWIANDIQGVILGALHEHWADFGRGALGLVAALAVRAMISAPRSGEQLPQVAPPLETD